MTRLITEWIDNMPQELEDYDRTLRDVLGIGFKDLAYAAIGETYNDAGSHKAAVVRISTGLGIIPGFAEAVRAILRFMGIDAFICEKNNVPGMAEGIEKKADLLFLADDDKFVGLNIKNGKLSDNDMCTVDGFIKVLDIMAESFEGRAVLVTGYGVLGKRAGDILLSRGAEVFVFDKRDVSGELTDSRIRIINEIGHIKEFEYIFDSSNEGSWLSAENLHPQVAISSPGIPISVTESDLNPDMRLIYDNLQLGAAIMLAKIIS